MCDLRVILIGVCKKLVCSDFVIHCRALPIQYFLIKSQEDLGFLRGYGTASLDVKPKGGKVLVI